MNALFALLFVLVATWLIWIPIREYRHAKRTGAHRIPFSRMLMRMTVAGCILGIGLMIFLAFRPDPDRTPLRELVYLVIAVVMAVVMFIAGLTDYLLVKRELLLGQKEIIRNLARSQEPTEDS